MGQGIGKIDGAAGRRAAGNLVAFELGEVVVGVQVVERAMFAEALVEVAALNAVYEWATVGRIKHFAVGVEGDAVAIRATFAEKFELVRDWLVSPQALLEFNSSDAASGGAAVDAVEPAIGAPREMVRHGLRVFHAEAG